MLKNKIPNLTENYDYILCDSKEALDYCYTKGLHKNITVLSNSPGILLDKNIQSKNLYKNWTKKKLVEFQKSILGFSGELYNTALSSSIFDNEIATLAAIHGNKFSNYLLKLSQIKPTFINKKILFIKLDDRLLRSELINPPWTKITKQLNISIYNYYPKNYSNVITKNDVKANFLKRFYLGGLESVVYRILMYLNKNKMNFSKKNILIVNENEIIIELVYKLFFNGYKVTDLRSLRINKIKKKNNAFKSLLKATSNVLKKRVTKFVIPEVEKVCIDHFYFELEEKLVEYFAWKKLFYDVLVKFKKDQSNKTIILMNHPSTPKGLALKNICNKLNIDLCSCQHGVTAEISKTHNFCLSQHDSSSSDVYLAFNKGSFNIAKKSPFNKTKKQFIYGAPKRYLRTGQLPNIFKKYEILYLSNNLYTGNLGGIASWTNDFEKAEIELSIIESLNKAKKKVTYKPYPEVNKRYYEKNPCLVNLRKRKNINVIDYNCDSRYLLHKSKLLVCATATSTVAWALMSNKPTVFINFKYLAPLKPEAYKLFKLGLFLCDYDSRNFSKNFINILNKDNKEIINIWNKKKIYRDKLIKNFISANKNMLLSDYF